MVNLITSFRLNGLENPSGKTKQSYPMQLKTALLD